MYLSSELAPPSHSTLNITQFLTLRHQFCQRIYIVIDLLKMTNAEEDLVASNTEGFKLGEKKTIEEYAKLGETDFIPIWLLFEVDHQCGLMK